MAGSSLEGSPSHHFASGRSQQAALDAHVAAENAHDLDSVMATFAADAVMVVNGAHLADPRSIRSGHELLGFGNRGAFANLAVVETRRLFTDDSVIVEGRLEGIHVGRYGHLEATKHQVSLPYCTIYQFNGAGLLVSERAYFDTSLVLPTTQI